MGDDLDGSPQGVDFTVVVTAHREGRLLRPTLRSIAAALDYLAWDSTRCELLIVLDAPTRETLVEARRWLEPGRVPAEVRIVSVSFQDPGSTRNAGVQHSRGRYVALCDGDDLVSRNYFRSALSTLNNEPESTIVHPSIVVSFGARALTWIVRNSSAVDHTDLIRHNLWPSSSVALRSTYVAHPYAALTGSGFGPEDWLWNLSTSIAGFTHRVAPQTAFFYRVRASGGVNNDHRTSVLPMFDLRGLITRLPPLPLSKPSMREVAWQAVKLWGRACATRVLPLVRLLVLGVVPARMVKLRARLRLTYRRLRRLTISPTTSGPIPFWMSTHLREASQLEPALSWVANGFTHLPRWAPPHDDYADILISLVTQLHGRASAIVAVPWVGIGGADLVSLNYARALAGSERYRGRVTILATHSQSRTMRELIPDDVHFVQVPPSFRDLDAGLQRRLLTQVLLLSEARLLVSVNCFDVTNALQEYGQALGSTMAIFLTLFAFDRIGDDFPVNPITDDAQRAYFDVIRRIITDNSHTAETLEKMLALGPAEVAVHYQPAMQEVPRLRKDTRSHEDVEFDMAHPFRLLWPHRMDKEKRPDVAIAIARRLRELKIPAEVHIHGQLVLSDPRHRLVKAITQAGIRYHGPYSGGLQSLATQDYHALLLTSESEGLPLVLVQSMLLGLPVIASAVGGVTDLVRHGETGLLAKGPDDIDGFVDAIQSLVDSRERRRAIIKAGYAHAVAQHSFEAFAEVVEEEVIRSTTVAR